MQYCPQQEKTTLSDAGGIDALSVLFHISGKYDLLFLSILLL